MGKNVLGALALLLVSSGAWADTNYDCVSAKLGDDGAPLLKRQVKFTHSFFSGDRISTYIYDNYTKVYDVNVKNHSLDDVAANAGPANFDAYTNTAHHDYSAQRFKVFSYGNSDQSAVLWVSEELLNHSPNGGIVLQEDTWHMGFNAEYDDYLLNCVPAI